MKLKDFPQPYDEAAARRVAHIIGPSSAAAQALAELERRRASGEEVQLFATRSTFIVGPPVTAPVEGER